MNIWCIDCLDLGCLGCLRCLRCLDLYFCLPSPSAEGGVAIFSGSCVIVEYADKCISNQLKFWSGEYLHVY